MKSFITIILIVSLILFLAGCGSSRNVTRTATDTTVDLSGRWNDADSRLTAEKMIDGLLNSRWIDSFLDEGV